MIDAFVRKQNEKKSGFRSVTDFRKIKAYLTAARAADRVDEVLERLHAFVQSDNLEIADLEIEAARIHREAESLTRQLSRLRSDVLALDPDLFLAEEDLWQELERFLSTIQEKLALGERREPMADQERTP